MGKYVNNAKACTYVACMLTSSSIELPLLELTVIEVEPRHPHRLETLLAAAEVELNPSEGLCGPHK